MLRESNSLSNRAGSDLASEYIPIQPKNFSPPKLEQDMHKQMIGSTNKIYETSERQSQSGNMSRS